MDFVGIIIILVVFGFVIYEIVTLVKSIKEKKLKKEVNKDGSNSDDRS